MYTERKHVARAPKDCVEPGCVRTKHIAKGESYVRVSGDITCRFRSFVLCRRCALLHTKAYLLDREKYLDGVPVYGRLRDHLLSVLRPNSTLTQP